MKHSLKDIFTNHPVKDKHEDIMMFSFVKMWYNKFIKDIGNQLLFDEGLG